MAAQNCEIEPSAARRNSKGPGRAPWKGLARAVEGLLARALPSLAAAAIRAFRGGTRWETRSLVDRLELTSQRGETRTFGNCSFPGPEAENSPPVLLLEK